MSESKARNNKKVWIGAISFVLIIGILFVVYSFFVPKTVTGDKNIVVEVAISDKDVKEFKISTNEEYLRGALEQMNLIAGEESEYGLFVKTVDGITVNDANQEWWCFTKGGDQINTSVDATPIEDGDHFEITFTEGY